LSLVHGANGGVAATGKHWLAICSASR
jgi:hypothetical protein